MCVVGEGFDMLVVGMVCGGKKRNWGVWSRDVEVGWGNGEELSGSVGDACEVVWYIVGIRRGTAEGLEQVERGRVGSSLGLLVGVWVWVG